MISLILPTQGNPIALKRTLESFKNICSEFIIGDLMIFGTDKALIKAYTSEYNIKLIPLPFNYIFKNGFSITLNHLAHRATNDLVLYMNCSEVVDGEERIIRLLEERFQEYNCFAMDHAEEKHSWFRLYNKKNVYWDGIIHEELVGDVKRCPFYLFRFKDTEKDSHDPFKAKVYNDIKEIVYFQQYINLIEQPNLKGITNDWWLKFANENYESMKHRLFDKGIRYEAFKENNLEKYIKAIYNSPEFEKERFESSKLVEFQGSYKSL